MGAVQVHDLQREPSFEEETDRSRLGQPQEFEPVGKFQFFS